MSSITSNTQFFFLSKGRAFLTAIAFLVCFIGAQNASAATFTVTRSDDRNATCNSGVDCSLREAVKAANSAPSNDLVNFASGLTMITLASGDSGDIQIFNASSLSIQGPGANVLTIDGGAGTNRIFYINNAAVGIYDLTMQGGNGNSSGNFGGQGGAIELDSGSLSLGYVVFKNNGGTNVFGSAVSFHGGGEHVIANSTFSGNQSKFGTIYLDGDNIGALTVVNSTISGNTATGEGGSACAAICNGGTTNIRNSTITNNTATAGDGGGIVNYGSLDIGNTIIAGNISPGNTEIANNGTVTSLGNNLIGDSPGDSTNTHFAVTYQASDIRDALPLLGALQNNGGLTPTHALLPGSPAIDKGGNALAANPINNAPIFTDQRGLTRIIDGDGNGTATADIGAFEVQNATTAASVSVSGRVTTANGRGIVNARVTLTESSGETRTAISGKSGYFRFDEATAGEICIFSVSAKRYAFSQPIQVRSINDDTDDIFFIADNAKQIFTTLTSD